MTATTAVPVKTTESKAIRADKHIIAQASEVAEEYGLTLASATRAFWAQMARTRSIPLTFESERPNEESREAIRETEEIIKNGGPSYASLDEMYKSLGI